MNENEYNDLLVRLAAQSGNSVEVVQSHIQAIINSDPEFWEQAAQQILDTVGDFPSIPQFQMGGPMRPDATKPYARRYKWGGPKDER